MTTTTPWSPDHLFCALALSVQFSGPQILTCDKLSDFVLMKSYEVSIRRGHVGNDAAVHSLVVPVYVLRASVHVVPSGLVYTCLCFGNHGRALRTWHSCAIDVLRYRAFPKKRCLLHASTTCAIRTRHNGDSTWKKRRGQQAG